MFCEMNNENKDKDISLEEEEEGPPVLSLWDRFLRVILSKEEFDAHLVAKVRKRRRKERKDAKKQ